MEEQKERRNLHELLETPKWQEHIQKLVQATLEYNRKHKKPARKPRPVDAPIPIGSPTKWA